MFGYHENEIRALDCDGSLGICMLVRLIGRVFMHGGSGDYVLYSCGGISE